MPKLRSRIFDKSILLALQTACGGAGLTTNYEQPTTNYSAKQTQFFKKSNVYNRNKNNELQRENESGHLVKTNPIKPNLWTPKNKFCRFS
jgi:hypothetical protein